MDPDSAAGPEPAAGTPATVSQVTQILLLLLIVALGLGLAYIVVVLAVGGTWTFTTFLAALSVLGVGAGLLIGYCASYGLVTSLVQYLGSVGSGIVLLFGFVTQAMSPVISVVISLAVGAISIVPRAAEVGTAAVMLLGSLVVFELTRRGYLFSWCIIATALWMTGAALLIGNGLAALQQRD